MHPMFSFNDIIEEELLLIDPVTLHFDQEAIHKASMKMFGGIGNDIEDSLTREQSQSLRISDVGSCSLALWAKINKLNTIPKAPKDKWSRLMAGSMFGALIGQIFKSAMERKGIECILEATVDTDGMSGHIDIVLPTFQHLYELKSNYGTAVRKPTTAHWLQGGLYCIGKKELGIDLDTVSIIKIQPCITGDRPRLYEYSEMPENLFEDAAKESFRLRRAAGSINPPEADVSAEDATWLCKSYCQYAQCAKNKNPMKFLANSPVLAPSSV